MTESRQIRVYVSSTFHDMHAEREHLASVVLPQLRARSEMRGLTIELVDLRYGVLDEASSEEYVLSNFLDEIQRCRPCFIGLLGEEYGYTPKNTPQGLLEKESWLQESMTEQKSVTELEFQHGALRNPKLAVRSFFYLRDPKYIESISDPEQKKPLISDDPAAAVKLQNLKAAIRSSGLIVREDYADATALGQLVLADFNNVIDEVFSEGPKTVLLSPEERERLMSPGKSAPAEVPQEAEEVSSAAPPVEIAAFQQPEPAPESKAGKEEEQAAPVPPKSDDASLPRILVTHLSGSKANSSQEFQIKSQQEILVGRDATSNVRYLDTDESVSRDHLRITQNFGDPNAYVLVTKGRNGTFINNQEVSGSNALRDGDIVQVGRGGPVFRFEQFPKPLARVVKPAKGDSESSSTLPPPADMAQPIPGNATVERKFDPVLAAQLQETAKREAESSRPAIIFKDTTDNMVFRPIKQSNSKQWVQVVAVAVVLALFAFLFWRITR